MENKTLGRQTLLAISDDLRPGMKPAYDELEHSIQYENFEDLSSWYMKLGLSKIEILSEIINQIIGKIRMPSCQLHTFCNQQS